MRERRIVNLVGRERVVSWRGRCDPVCQACLAEQLSDVNASIRDYLGAGKGDILYGRFQV
jgi:hypothetical protein